MTHRYVEIDALKVAGIATVVLIHGLRPPWDPALGPLELWLGHLTRFAVPAFLAASGFLYASGERVPPATTRRRLRRVLVPYAIASIGAQAWWAWRGDETPGGSLLPDLLFGSSFGPYYYVFVIAVLICLTPALARLPRLALEVLAVLLVAAQWAVDAAAHWPLPFYWHLRNPLLWWAYFVAGWLLRLHYDRVWAWLEPRRLPIAGLLGAIAVGMVATSSLPGPLLVVRSAAWLGVWAILALVFVLAGRARRSPRLLRWASDASFAIYLFHLFFVYTVQLVVPPERGDAASILLPWTAGLAGSLLWVAGLQRLLGRRSRDWIGA